jgi:peptidoglycan/LPS O-acetylase OafA/YrhL
VAVRDPDHRPGAEPAAVQQAAHRRVNTPAWNLLLLLPLVGVLVPAVYNKADPQLGGIPFFYWYQMLWVPLGVLVTVVVYRATRGER